MAERREHAEFEDRFDQKVHPCGCETYWDTVQDRSRTLRSCEAHRPRLGLFLYPADQGGEGA